MCAWRGAEGILVMTLTIGTGPFGDQGSGEFNFEVTAPEGHALYFEESPRRVRVMFGGETIADSRSAKLLHERDHLPLYYFPEEDVRMDLLEKTTHTTHCPFKGDASYWSVKVGESIAENSAWSYPEPIENCPPISGFISFYWNAMDSWFEEDEEVFVHARDPYHRVDVLDSSRHVKVSVAGEVIAETRNPKLLFETGLPTRYYIPPENVKSEKLRPSETRTECPYKGTASYYSVAGYEEGEDAIWHYPEPIAAVGKVAEHLCFYNERVDLEVDGEALPRPKTRFS